MAAEIHDFQKAHALLEDARNGVNERKEQQLREKKDKRWGKNLLAALSGSGVQIWQAFRFRFSKKKLWKAPFFKPGLLVGIRQRSSEWKTETFLYTSCAFTCQSAAIKLLPHGQSAKIWILKTCRTACKDPSTREPLCCCQKNCFCLSHSVYILTNVWSFVCFHHLIC